MKTSLTRAARLLAAASLLIGARDALAINRVCLDEAQRQIHGDTTNEKVSSYRALASGDVDNDGHPDILIGDSGVVRVYFDASTSAFHETTDVAYPSLQLQLPMSGPFLSIATNIAVGDVNGDDDNDVVVLAGVDGWVFLGPFAAAPATDSTFEIELHPSVFRYQAGVGGALAVGDLDGDTVADIVVGDEQQQRPPYSITATANNPTFPMPLGMGNNDHNAGQVHVIFGDSTWAQSMTVKHYQLDSCDVTPAAGRSLPDVSLLGEAGLAGTPGIPVSPYYGGDYFGTDLMIAQADYCNAQPDLYIGAPGRQDNPLSHLGAFYIVRGGAWLRSAACTLDMRSASLRQRIDYPGTQLGTRFGGSLASDVQITTLGLITAIAVIVGADGYDRLPEVDTGQAFVLNMNTTTGCETYVDYTCEVRGATPHGRFGYDVGVSHLRTLAGASSLTELVVSEPYPFDVPGSSDPQTPGRVYVICDLDCPLLDMADDPPDVTMIEGAENNDRFGFTFTEIPGAAGYPNRLGIGAHLADGMSGSTNDAGAGYFFATEECPWCNDPPVVDASATTATTFTCGGSLSVDVTASVTNDDATLTHAWTTNCPGGSFANASALSTTLTFTADRCDETCSATFTVSDCRYNTSQPCYPACPTCTDTIPIVVDDNVKPVLAGVPANATAECGAVPSAPAVTATDCGASVSVSLSETTIPGSCPGNYKLVRTWSATDVCGNTEADDQEITVTDTTPPTILEDDSIAACLWPPNHDYVCFDTSDFAPTVSDTCSSPVTWTFSDCASDQADNGLGDGNTTDDCDVAPDGLSFCVRSERSGRIREGRRYTVTITATDACGNSSAAQTVGVIYVPHDQRDRANRACISPND